MTERIISRSRILPPVYFLIALIAMMTLHYFVPGARLFDSPLRYSGIFLVVAGIALVLWAAVLFRQAGTAIRPFQESAALVAGGPYRVTRNPMYVGMVGVLLGVSVLLGSTTPLLVVPAFAILIDFRFIRAEEAILETRFGSAYTEYKSKVPRWL